MVEILKQGLYTTIQDLGRSHSSHLGIPISGSMDRLSSLCANMILGNDENMSVLECTIIGPEIRFHEETKIAIAGAVIQPFINGTPSSMNDPIAINSGDILSFGRVVKGARFYIAVKGGFQGESVMNSQSACITASIFELLKVGNTIPYQPYHDDIENHTSIIRNPSNHKIEVIQGPEFESIANKTSDDFDELLTNEYNISQQSNRMAYRVNHPLDLTHKENIISSGTIPGTVQLTPSGEIIILMRDAQTTGGYPRILQLSEKGICDLAQLKAGEKFSFLLNTQS